MRLISKEETIFALWKGHVSAQVLSIIYGISQVKSIIFLKVGSATETSRFFQFFIWLWLGVIQILSYKVISEIMKRKKSRLLLSRQR